VFRRPLPRKLQRRTSWSAPRSRTMSRGPLLTWIGGRKRGSAWSPSLIRRIRRICVRSISGPPVLFLRGSGDDRDAMSVAVVGTRNPTSHGVEQARHLATGLVKRDIPVISGLAAGIDTAAHTAALAAGGRTVAVIGTGIDPAGMHHWHHWSHRSWAVATLHRRFTFSPAICPVCRESLVLSGRRGQRRRRRDDRRAGNGRPPPGQRPAPPGPGASGPVTSIIEDLLE